MTKNICIMILMFFAGVFPIYGEENSGKLNGDRVIVYYFHGDFRCSNCIKFEEYAKETVNTFFSNELSSGRLEYKAVNIDEKGNEHYVDKYGLYTKSLILSLVKDDQEIKYKNLEKIWEYTRDKQKFIDYVKNEIQQFLNY